MDTDIEKAVAYLHDVLEDTNVTMDELRKMFPNEIVDGVLTLTHRKDESYFEYISRVSTSKLAKKVKAADLLHNLDITRIKEPTKQDYQRLEKYKKAILSYYRTRSYSSNNSSFLFYLEVISYH